MSLVMCQHTDRHGEANKKLYAILLKKLPKYEKKRYLLRHCSKNTGKKLLNGDKTCVIQFGPETKSHSL
jgi:hypothetical protein